MTTGHAGTPWSPEEDAAALAGAGKRRPARCPGLVRGRFGRVPHREPGRVERASRVPGFPGNHIQFANRLPRHLPLRPSNPAHSGDSGRIDFATLEKVGTELVGEALVRRYPDMLWTARTRDGARRVLILTELQGQRDRLMPLRTSIYCHLAVQELLERTRPAPSPDSIDVLLPMVIYHGPGAWRGPTSLDELIPLGIPREFRVIFRDSESGGSGAAVDLVGALASLDRERSPAGTIEALGSLRRVAEKTGDRLDGLLAECIGAWLVSEGRITEDQNREATAMTQVMTE